jgi:hypothetical protein
LSACFLFTLSTANAAPPKADAPPPAALAEAKKNFEVGLKLYKDGLVKEALAAFLAANKIAARASVLRNIGQCQRDLHDFAAAYETYIDLLERFRPSMKPAEVKDTERALDELSLLTGTIAIDAPESGATVTIDEKEVGTTPLPGPVRVNLGAHTVNVAKSGFEPFSKQVTIQGKDQLTLEAKLEKEIRTGHLAVKGVGPADQVLVIVDGKEVGPLPWEGDLDPGAHQVEAKGPKSAAVAQRVEIKRREKSELTLELQAQTGVLYVDPHNAQAQIMLDGAVVGKGVWEGTVTPERHELLVTAPLYKPLQRVFMVHVGERVTETTPLVLEEGVSLHDFRGLYVGINLLGRFGGAPTNEFAENCPVQRGSCDFGKAAGFGGLLRIGYSFGWLGAEVIGMGSFDVTSADAEYQAVLTEKMSPHFGPPRHEQYEFQRAGAGAGLGVRATSKHTSIRFTGGMGLLMALRAINARTETEIQIANPNPGCFNCSNTEHHDWNTKGSKAIPMLLLDGGLLLGGTPGTKFQLGILAALEFYGDPLVTDGQGPDNVQGTSWGRPGVQAAHGTEVFIGPVLGLQFGE